MLQLKDTDWLNRYENKTHIYAIYKKLTSDLKTYRLKVKGWEIIFHTKGKQKKPVVAVLISDKIDLKIRKITRDKEGHYIMIRGSIQEKNVMIVNIYAPNIGAPQYIRQTLIDIKGEIDSNTILAGDFNTPSHQWTNQKNRKLIRKHKS